MKVTFALPLYEELPLGGYKVVYEYSNHLAGNGHEVSLIYPWQCKGADRLSSNLSPRMLFGRLSRQRLSAYLAKKPEINWFHFDSKINLIKVPDLQADHLPDADAIFATAWRTSPYINDCPREKGAHFYLVMDFAPWLGNKQELEQTWRLPLKKIAISSWLAELVTQAGVPKADVQAIPIAVDQRRFQVLSDIRSRPQRVIMLYSSHPYKRSQFGLSAVLECKRLVPNLQATFFGPVPKRPPELPSWIDYYGNVSETGLVALYNAASICLCSSAAEGFALPPAEAMASGCAVVTTDCGGNRDYAKHEKTALVSDPDDSASLVANLLRLLRDELLRVNIALAGRKCMTKFTWEKSTDDLIEFVNRNL